MEYTPWALHQRHSPRQLYRQCVISRQLWRMPQDWNSQVFHGFRVGTHPELPVTEWASAGSSMQALFLGYVIDPAEKSFNRPGLGGVRSFADLELRLDRMSGRFMCLAHDGQSCRLYLDASGSYSMMYDPELRMLASSAMLIPYREHNGDDSNLVESLALHEKNGIYPFGLTSRHTIRRLLPNHYLSLDSWTATRYWPKEKFSSSQSTEALAASIGDMLQSTIAILVNAGYQPYMSLTAGVDSRTLLACGWDVREHIRFFTWALPDAIAEQDIQVASEIAQKYGLNYEVFPYHSAGQHDVEGWLYRTSVTVGELRGQDLTTTVATMDRHQPYIAGNVSEVSRGVYWKEADHGVEELSGEELIRRLNAPLEPVFIHAAKRWLAGLPAFLTARDALDLLYLEQKVGCWASEIAHGHACGPFHIYPFSNRQIFAAMLGSDPDYDFRKTKGIIKEIIRQRQPSLLDWEFNGGERRQ